MSITDRVLKSLYKRRENVLSGNVNCIPSPFDRFKNDFPGVEQGKYYLISGATKSGKTQIANYLFLYNSIIFAYNNPDKIDLKIFYFPLEETQEAITLRFMSYLLYVNTRGQIRKSPSDLKSTLSDQIIDEEVLKLFEQSPYKEILAFYEDHVVFNPARNPYGIYHEIDVYAKNNGTVHKKPMDIIDNKTGEVIETKEVFDYYTADNPKEYVMIMVDHISLITPEKGMDLRESINRLSDYMIKLRNNYNYIPVIIQQQGQETTNLEAFKANKIRPTVAGLSDSKYTAKDCTVFLGITNPYAHELPEYAGYNIKELKAYARFLEVVINREGQSNGMIGLYFDGACNYYKELPNATDKEALQEVYKRVHNNINPVKKNTLLFIFNKLFKKHGKYSDDLG